MFIINSCEFFGKKEAEVEKYEKYFYQKLLKDEK